MSKLQNDDKRLRLSLDMGSNSIGWTLFELDAEDWPIKILRTGSRIFSNSRNAKTNVPLSVERRIARGARRRRDRNLARKKSLVKFLSDKNIMPTSIEQTHLVSLSNPYQLRHEGLERKLEDWELSRVLLHLSQRRGFKSNRKNLDKKEGASLETAINELENSIQELGTKTLGSFLYQSRVKNGLSTRMRPDSGWYPTRKMYQVEFQALKEKQAPLFKSLSINDWSKLEHLLFHQRPLQRQQPGLCRYKFEQKKERAPRALPSFQQFRMFQQLANLKINRLGQPSIALSKEQHQILLNNLLFKEKLDFKKAKELLDLDDCTFNLEEGANSFKSSKYLYGDRTSYELSKSKYFGKLWKEIDLKIQNEIVAKLLFEENDDTLIDYLKSNWSLSDEQIRQISLLGEDDFEKGYAEFCEEVLNDLSSHMKEDHLLTYDKAVIKLGFHHSDTRPETLSKYLPYYGDPLRSSCRITPDCKSEEEKKFGKIANPTVHVALNQLRKIVNLLIQRHGYIEQIIVETARDLPLGEQGLGKLAKEYRDNEKKNDFWTEELKKLGQPSSFNNRLRFRLWHELGESADDRRCPYSGEMIGISKLFSPEIEVDHILPRSRTFSNHHSNLTLCTRKANQYKGDRSPYEAFSSPSSPYSYSEILLRVRHMPIGKQRKFAPDAMEEFIDSSGFLERQLNDTRFISKATCQYLQSVCRKVWVSRGKLTAFIRSDLNLNSLLSADRRKNRNDHRHHAVDAFVIGLTPPKTLVKCESYIRRKGKSEETTPLTKLIAEFSEKLKGVIVSHKIDHSPSGKLFEETAYGKLKNGQPGELTIRKEIAGISDFEDVVDEKIRNYLISLGSMDKKDMAIKVFEKFGVKKLKIIKKDGSAVKIDHPKQNVRFRKYLTPSEINKIEFWRMPGEDTDKLHAVGYSSLEVLGKVNRQPHRSARKLLSIHKGDCLRLEDEQGIFRTVVVESLSPVNKKLFFTEHNIAKNDNAVGRTIVFNAFAKKNIRVVRVNEIGEVRDAGAWWINDTKSNRNSKSG